MILILIAATVSINGQIVGRCENEFLGYIFTLDKALLKARNVIKIDIFSPVYYCLDRAAKSPYLVPYSQYMNGEKHWNQIRKAACAFGWYVHRMQKYPFNLINDTCQGVTYTKIS